MSISKEVLLDLYEQMLLIRRFEERVAVEYRKGRIPGFVHLYIGEEAIAVGVCAHLEKEDFVSSTHRGHGHALAKGVPAREVMAELFGRATGCSGGRGGSMHLFSARVGFMGTSGLVGPSIPTAAGAAYTIKYRQRPNVAVGFFGDGMVNNGAFHEGLNLAALWELPVVFVCENNLYATEMPFEKATKNTDVAARAESYGMRSFRVNGMCIEDVYRVAQEAISLARKDKGPTLISADTYRFVGHHEGDSGRDYRTQAEIEKWKQRDPLQNLRQRLAEECFVSDDTLTRFEEKVLEIVQDAVDYSEQSSWPDPEQVLKNVFSRSYPRKAEKELL